VFIVIGAILGVGIFATPGVALSLVATDDAGAGSALVVWLSAGVIAAMQSLCYAELGASITSAGGQYDYLKIGFGEFVGYSFNFQNVFINLGSVAGIALIFAAYLSGAVFPSSDASPLQIKVIALTLTWVLTFVNLLGVKAGALIANSLGVVKIVLCLAIVIAGVSAHFQQPDRPNGFNGGPLFSPVRSVPDIGSAVVACYYSYGGGQTIGSFAEEMEDPGRTIPIAVMFGTFVVVVLYLLLNGSYLLVCPLATVAESDRLAITFMERAVGSTAAGRAVGFGISLSAAATLSIYLAQNARTTFACARDGLFPR
jgi:amino acid transporter